MSSCLKVGLATLLALAASLAQAQAAGFPGIGRAATPKEIAAWDIDVRPDFAGLPAGSGTVASGMDIWETKCASCHGVFGESNEVFTPLVGGTTAQDVKTGRVARLLDASYPGRTTMMKVATISTLWDYIRRAMPWTQPKSLTVDEVYAVTAYLLNMADVLPADFTLSDRNIDQVQARMPNRLGMTNDHALWPGRGFGRTGRPDVKALACMKDCPTEAQVKSFLPDFARNAHGNLAEQNRLVGAQHGADTSPPPAPGKAPSGAAPRGEPVSGASAAMAATQKNGCTACHTVETKLVGPGFREIARKHAGRTDAAAYLADKIRLGGSGVWGEIPMPPQTLNESDAKMIADWLADGARK